MCYFLAVVPALRDAALIVDKQGRQSRETQAVIQPGIDLLELNLGAAFLSTVPQIGVQSTEILEPPITSIDPTHYCY